VVQLTVGDLQEFLKDTDKLGEAKVALGDFLQFISNFIPVLMGVDEPVDCS